MHDNHEWQPCKISEDFFIFSERILQRVESFLSAKDNILNIKLIYEDWFMYHTVYVMI